MVDAADRGLLQEAKIELDALLDTEELEKVPILILGNKTDCAGAVSEAELRRELELPAAVPWQKDEKASLQVLQRAGTAPLELCMCSVIGRQGYQRGLWWLMGVE